jgi:hypothetical protein
MIKADSFYFGVIFPPIIIIAVGHFGSLVNSIAACTTSSIKLLALQQIAE